MSIAAAILILGACGSASRTITVEPSIERIVWQVVAGGVKDVWSERGNRGNLNWVTPANLELSIDGQPRTGVIAWIAAAYRVAGYALDRRTSGSVEYSYRLRVRGFVISRHTRISDGRVSLVTDVYGSIGPRGELHHVRLVLDAQERNGGTVIVGTATGWSEIGERCSFVAAIARRQIGRAMDRELLARVQASGIDLYRAGGIAEVLR